MNAPHPTGSPSYAVMTLDRKVKGGWPLLLQAWDEAKQLLAEGHPRVAIVDAMTRDIRMVLQAPNPSRGGE